MGISVLGPLDVDGRTSGLSPKDRVVLAALVLGQGRHVSTDTLADAVWGQRPPASSVKLIQGCVVRLRKMLGAGAIESGAAGYRLTLTDDEIDHRRFERLLDGARDALDGDPARASYLVREALDLWRGDALSDLGDWEAGRVEAARLDGLRMDAEELLVAAELGAGHARTVLERARTLVAQSPFREGRWVLLATALHHVGRQAEALAAVQRAKRMLADELGLDPGRELAELEEQLLRDDPSLVPPEEYPVSSACPYRGLLPYGSEDSDSFFGRDDDTAACLRRLRDAGVLAVVGPSGIGKSSLVLAAVVPALTRAGTSVFATTPGLHPLDSLAGLKPRGRQTLVVDQVEEAVTVCTDAAERERYFAALAAHVGAGGQLVLSLRADHLGDLAPYPEVTRVLEEGLYLLGPMGEEELRSAVEAPARQAGLKIEPGLVDLVVREVEGEPAALPLLSHVLRETWLRREGPTLTVSGYHATGGVRRAVAQSAEALYDSMDDSQRSRLRSFLLRLVMSSGDGDAVRAKVALAKLAMDGSYLRLVEQLVDARLVSIDGDTVQIAHEALFRVWPRLRGWLDDDVEGQRLFQHLAGAADAWDAMGRPESELYRGVRLNRTLEWRERTQPDLSTTESAFLAASAGLSESELRAAQESVQRERRVNGRLRVALAGIAALAVFALVAGVLAVRAATRAQDDRNLARSAADLAEARTAGATALQHQDSSVALLLALSALQVDTSSRAWDNLTAVLMHAPSLLSTHDPGGYVVDLAASPTGSLLAVSRANEGTGLLLLDAATFEPLPFYDDIPASGIDFSPDGKLLAMAVNQWSGAQRKPPRLDAQPVRLYDMPAGTLADQQLGGFPEHASVEYALDFSADGRRFVAAVDQLDPVSGVAKATFATVWDLTDPSRPVFTVRLPEYPVLKLSPDGARLYVALSGLNPDRPIRVYEVDSGRLVSSLQTSTALIGTLAPGALSPDGSTFAIAEGPSLLRLDAQTLKPAGPVLRGDDGDTIGRVEYSNDGSQLAAATENGQLLVWDTATGKLTHRLANGGSPQGLDFSADGKALHSAASGLNSWDLTGEAGLYSRGKASIAGDYAASKAAPDGRTLVRERGGQLWFVDNETGRETARVTVSGVVDAIHAWAPDSRWLLRYGGNDRLQLWDASTARLVAERALTGEITVAFSPSGEQVYVSALAKNSLMVLDATSLESVRSPIDLGRAVGPLVPHPRDGSVFAIGRDGAVLRVVPSTGSTTEVAPVGTFPTESWDAEVSPGGELMLAPNLRDDNVEVQLIRTDSWARFGPAAPSEERLGTFDLAPDGTQFATLDEDKIAFFSGTTGAPQGTIPLPSPTPGARLSYLPNSRSLVVTGLDGSTWIVDATQTAWMNHACATAGRNLSHAEWGEYFPSRPYQVACPSWPAGA